MDGWRKDQDLYQLLSLLPGWFRHSKEKVYSYNNIYIYNVYVPWYTSFPKCVVLSAYATTSFIVKGYYDINLYITLW